MELTETCEELLNILDARDILSLKDKLFKCVRENNCDIYEKYKKFFKDLSKDNLQPVFQYYYADRKEKMQDYTPQCLGLFISKLIGKSDIVVDMCAGSGALTIQKWSEEHNTEFHLYEFDENVIPFLLFNMAVRNIKCIVYHTDVLENKVFHTYAIDKGEQFGIFKEVINDNIANI